MRIVLLLPLLIILLAVSVRSTTSCEGCGYNCDDMCNCARCNTKSGCMTENTCLQNCNSGGNAKWCGLSPPSPSPPLPPKHTWTISSNNLQRDGKNVVLHGIGTTCTEYLLRGIGMRCFTHYDWTNPSALLQVDEDAMKPFLDILQSASSQSVIPAVRIPLTASSWLGVRTEASVGNFQKYPNLSAQYQNFVSDLVERYTSNGIVTILDLHWIDDDVEQQPMATKDTNSSALIFWDSIATTFGKNSMVFYELYNEPHVDDVDVWMNGDASTAGMVEMLEQVRRHTKNPAIIAGALQYAYDDASLIQLDAKLEDDEVVLYNFHPYMGPNQVGATNKCPSGFADLVRNIIASTEKPLVITEFGQSCCPTHGACERCPQRTTGYDEDILQTCKELGISWLPWAWRPGASGPNPKSCQDIGVIGTPNETFPSVLAHPTDGNGGDFLSLWNDFK